MIEIEFVGAAQTVTGSKHVIRTSRATVLVDCGMYQGRRADALARNAAAPVDLSKLDAVVLSHAHIDHSGALPVLAKLGWRGRVFATPATRDLCVPMLEDSANIQVSDAKHIASLIAKGHRDLRPVVPLYTPDDVADLLRLMHAVPYHQRFAPAPGVQATFLEAGHVLGSAVVVLDLEDEGVTRRVAFTGDIGRPHLPILRDPEVPDRVDCLLTESTYGDRLHGPIERTTDGLAAVVERTRARGGKVVIPSFALERAQEVIYELKRLRLAGRMAAIPVYVDSPLTVKLTDVFKLHPECYDRETFDLLRSGNSPFDFEGLHYVSTVEDSKAIDADRSPSIIIASSGMCEGGRVLHHLKRLIDDPKNSIVIVGYQAEHTLGRRIAERRPEVRIFGDTHALRAEVTILDGFSAHADQAGLVAYAEAVRAKSPALRRLMLVHGELPAQTVLADLLRRHGFPHVDIPRSGDRIRL